MTIQAINGTNNVGSKGTIREPQENQPLDQEPIEDGEEKLDNGAKARAAMGKAGIRPCLYMRLSEPTPAPELEPTPAPEPEPTPAPELEPDQSL